MAKKLAKSDYEKLAEFRYALRKFLQFSEASAKKVGLTPQQHQALLAIKGFPGRDYVTIGELAERLQIQHNSAVGLVDRLAAEKLLKRQNATPDRRHVFVQLSRKGEQILEKLSAAHHKQLEQVGPELSRLLNRAALG